MSESEIQQRQQQEGAPAEGAPEPSLDAAEAVPAAEAQLMA